MAEEKVTVATPDPIYASLAETRKIVSLLRGSAKDFVANSEVFWKSPGESTEGFKWRKRAVRMGRFYWSSANHLGSQPFSRRLTFSDGAPKITELLRADADGKGTGLEQLARESCILSAGYGLHFWVVLWDKDRGRPYIRTVGADSVLNPYIPGSPVRVHFKAVDTDPAEPWKKTYVDEVWVFTAGEDIGSKASTMIEIYRKTEPSKSDSEWEKISTVETKTIRSMPVIPIPTSGVSDEIEAADPPWIAGAPMPDLAESNVAWINKRSDLDWGLHIANMPQPYALGISKTQADEFATKAVDALWWSENHEASFGYLEHSGVSFELSAKELADDERRMEVQGSQPNVTRAGMEGGPLTATAEARDLSRALTRAQAMALVWQTEITRGANVFAEYANQGSSPFEVGVYTNFGPKEEDLERARVIQSDYQHGDLDDLTYFTEMKRLRVYGEAFDPVAAAQAAIARRERTLALLGGGGNSSSESDDPEED